VDQQQFDDEIDLREYFGVILKQWKLIVVVTLAVSLAAFLYSSSQKPVYEAKATVLIRSGGVSAMSQYAGLAGILGINPGNTGGNLGDLTELIKSRAVAIKVLEDLKLTQRIKGWDDPKSKKEDLAAAVGGMLGSLKTIGNILEIKAEANDPQLAADVANEYFNAISYFWNELNYTEAQKKLKYIQAELPRVERDLRSVEDKLKLAPRSTMGLALSGQGSLQRDFDIYSSVYTMLRKEYESTKLEASKEIVPFSMLDPALKPSSPSKPKVKLNTMIGLVLGAFIGIFGAFFLEYWEKSSKK
jgi:uncharacterized protein involved in exopolysaccharide biosynthesis